MKNYYTNRYIYTYKHVIHILCTFVIREIYIIDIYIYIQTCYSYIIHICNDIYIHMEDIYIYISKHVMHMLIHISV